LRVRLDEPPWWYRADARGIATWLAPLASAYGRAAIWRYARTPGYRSHLPVICVGNFTAGGTGKTPLVMYLCEHLGGIGQRPVALTRGYGGYRTAPHRVTDADTALSVGDEALLLARAAPAVVARDRALGARAIEQDPAAATVIVMDDGLLNPQLRKDFAIAVVDGGRGIGNGQVMPAGPLRAPLEFQLGLADAIVVNDAAAGAGDQTAEWLRRRYNGPVLRSSTVAAGDTGWMKGQRIVAWAGIGAPDRFFTMLEKLGAAVMETVKFRDHQPLGEPDAGRLLEVARAHKAVLVSTEKDLARLKGATGACADLAAATRALPIRMHFADVEAERLHSLLDSALTAHR
jgi:tetraacyldisaccharide 4'-kinase